MPLPLLIIGGVAVIGGLAIANNTGLASNIGKSVNRLTQNKQEREHELNTKTYELEKSKRGFGDNIYAFFFGEKALAKTFNNDLADNTPVNTGVEPNPQGQPNSYGRNIQSKVNRPENNVYQGNRFRSGKSGRRRG